jgi:hypothetical protein
MLTMFVPSDPVEELYLQAEEIAGYRRIGPNESRLRDRASYLEEEAEISGNLRSALLQSSRRRLTAEEREYRDFVIKYPNMTYGGRRERDYQVRYLDNLVLQLTRDRILNSSLPDEKKINELDEIGGFLWQGSGFDVSGQTGRYTSYEVHTLGEGSDLYRVVFTYYDYTQLDSGHAYSRSLPLNETVVLCQELSPGYKFPGIGKLHPGTHSGESSLVPVEYE